MRNLSLSSQLSARCWLNSHDDEETQLRYARTTVDPDTNTVYLAVVPRTPSRVLTPALFKIHQNTKAEVEHFSDLSQYFQHQPSNSATYQRIVGLRFLPDQQAVCLASAQGDILLTTEDGETECVGSVESGISCMEWSPDDEIVAIVTGHGTILLMTKDFDILSEQPIDVGEPGADVSVNVGWGRKETQFHGTAGKEAALKPKNETHRLSPNDDGHGYVSWRGDGTYFVCSVVDGLKERRVVRVYNREGILQSTAEPVDGLEHSLSWRPSGNLIASSQHNAAQKSHDIIFLERNGLRHGSFGLREGFGNCRIVSLTWNCDSSILAIHLERAEENVDDMEPRSYVQLWTTSNYHWFLKQEITAPPTKAGSPDPIIAANWDIEKPTVLHVVTGSGLYFANNYTWDYCIGSHHASAQNTATAAVIDGATVNITPFRHLNVPPPMSAFQIEFPAPMPNAPSEPVVPHKKKSRILEVSFAHSNHGNSFAVRTTDGYIWLCEVQTEAKEGKILAKDIAVSVLRKIRFSPFPKNHTMRHFTYIKPTTANASAESSFLLVLHDPESDEDLLCKVEVEGDQIVNHSMFHLGSEGQRVDVLKVVNNVDENEVAVVGTNGLVWKVALSDFGIKSFPGLHKMPEQCEYVLAAVVGGSDPTTTLVGLTSRNKLYCGDHLIASDATSFFVHNAYIIYTTLTHVIRFVPLENAFDFNPDSSPNLQSMSDPASRGTMHDESTRRTERGSRIVMAIPMGVGLVLQMPRGNLETVNPRALLLSAVAHHLDRLEYRHAFLLCRKNRLDLNYICDYMPSAFLNNVDGFVDQVKDPEFLNLFLSSLRNEDVYTTMYAVRSKSDQWENCAKCNVLQKVNTICDLIRGILETRDQKTYVNSILTSYVRKSPPDLEDALRMIQVLHDTNSSHAEDALKYIIFLADVDRLYDVALGMYDFRLVLMVAQHSQKDPREYLPFLTGLQSLEKYFQRYKIDDHLGRREKALRNLSTAGEQHFDQCLHYIKTYSLYSTALELFVDEPVKYMRTMALYGDYLSEVGEYLQSAMAYVASGKNKEAITAYNRACAWKEMFSIATEEGCTAEEINDLAKKVVERLVNKGRFDEAAIVLLDYTRDLEGAVAMFLRGSHWADAARIAMFNGKPEYVESHVKPGILSGAELIKEVIVDMKELLEKQAPRLGELREAKKAQMDLPDNDALDNVDVMSDSTSMASSFSRATAATTHVTMSSVRTGKTIQSKRKQNRKKWRGKKGSVHEEGYLIDSLWRLMDRGSKIADEVSSCLKALVRYGYLKEARDLQTSYGDVLDEFRRRVDSIFKDGFAADLNMDEEEDEVSRLPTRKPEIIDSERWALTILEKS